LSDLSDQLLHESKRYERKARDLNSWFLLKQYGPIIGAALFFLLLLFARFYFW
jgi:hypothetical protein